MKKKIAKIFHTARHHAHRHARKVEAATGKAVYLKLRFLALLLIAIAVLVLLGVPFYLTASVKVVDPNGTPIKDAMVFVVEKGLSMKTNYGGFASFEIGRAKESLTVVVEKEGYYTLKKVVFLSAGETAKIKITPVGWEIFGDKLPSIGARN